jgi:RHS repeat-associated protein
MELSQSQAFSVPLLAAMPQLKEKPRLGVPSKNPAPNPGHSFCNSTLAVGLRAELHINAIRSRSTGKERDTESGLDYFGARYYGSSMGRWMSPDANDNGDYSDSSNPQSWNLYSYVLNNPLTHTDADGHAVNVCDANGQNCHTIWDDQTYANAQQQDKQLNGPSLSQLQNSGQSMNITDSSGNTVGTAQWVPNNPGIDGPANAAIFGQIGNQGMSAIKYFAAGSVIAGGTGGVGLYASGAGAGLTTLGDLSLSILPNNEAGAIIGWGTGQAQGVIATEQLTATLTEQDVAAMEAKGLNPSTVDKLMNVYERAVAEGKGGTQAVARKALMEKISQFIKR